MHKLLVGLILMSLTLASLPGAVGVISYGGANTESTGALADGDSNIVNNAPGGSPILFMPDKEVYTTFPGKPLVGGYDPIVVDPSGLGPYSRYAHAYVYSGVDIPAGTAGSANTEWHGSRDASATRVLASGDTVNMRAIVDGGTRAAASSDGNNARDVQAESLIDAFAALDPNQQVLIGNAQITSRVEIDTTGQAIAGTTKRLTVGDGPQGEAMATFAADRVHTVGGTTQTVAKILGTAKGTTNVEAQNTNNGQSIGNQTVFGYATVNTMAGAEFRDTGGILNGHISYSSSDIRSSGFALRRNNAGNGPTIVTSVASGSAESQAWDPDSSWTAPKQAGTETAATKVSGYTSALAEAPRERDVAFGNPIGTAGYLSVNPTVINVGQQNIPVGQVWSQIHSAAGSEMDIFGTPATANNERDAISFTYTTAYVNRGGATQADQAANAVKAYTYIGDISKGWTDAGNAMAVSRDNSQSDMVSQASLNNVLQSSGSHMVSTSVAAPVVPVSPIPTATGSTAGLVARATFDPTLQTGLTQVPAPGMGFPTVADLGYGGLANPFFMNGFITSGPGFTFNQFDAAGSLVISDSQEAVSTSSAGTYRVRVGPEKVQEWIVGNDPLNNLYVETPASVTYNFPNAGTAVPIGAVHNAGNPDIYAWNGAVGGPQ